MSIDREKEKAAGYYAWRKTHCSFSPAAYEVGLIGMVSFQQSFRHRFLPLSMANELNAIIDKVAGKE